MQDDLLKEDLEIYFAKRKERIEREKSLPPEERERLRLESIKEAFPNWNPKKENK